MERSLKKKYWADQAKKSVLLIPALVLLLAFFIIPIVLTVYYSFTNMALTGAAAQNFQFIGLENYKRILSDPNTLVSIRNTFIFLIGSLVGQSVLGFLIAYFMKGKAKAFRSVVGPSWQDGLCRRSLFPFAVWHSLMFQVHLTRLSEHFIFRELTLFMVIR